MIRDKIVFSMKDKHLQERLLREVKLTLGWAVDICKSAEVTRREVQKMKKSPMEAPKTMHVVNSKWRNKESYRTKEHKPEKADKKAKKPWKCFCCGQQHDYMKCPAYRQKCGKCSVFNHFAEFCRSERSVREIVQTNDESDDEFFIDSLCIGNIERGEDEWFSEVQCNASPIHMKLDTGAATNVIPLKTYNKLEPKQRLHNLKTKLKGYGGHKVEDVGKCQIDWDQIEVCEFYVVDGRVPPILGLQACKKLGLVVRGIATVTKTIMMESLSNESKDVCEGLRCFQKPYHIELKEGAVPIK